ncbi:hypothetical protein [Polaromonas sp.]|uniref:hypothetical protein n=1 Tax=Polaromonas sp. TaxID=1869339 RepID=UPI003265129E
MSPWIRILIVLSSVAIAGCASIPPEAPELSGQLGTRITAIESSHNRLLEQFFAEKRRRVDEFVQEVWVPTFAAEFFGDQQVDAVWKQVVASNDPKDRLRFVVMVGAKLQSKINEKRIELIEPLEDLERTVKAKLKVDYDQARAINNTLTSFLQSASKVEANRKRYLEMLGITDKQVEAFIDETDEAVSDLVVKAKGAQDKANSGKAFVEKVKSIAAKIKS